MRNRRKLLVGMLSGIVGLVGLLSGGRVEARKGGLPLCLDQLATCQTELDACEAEPNVVFPGDGQEGTDLDFGLDHGPALSYRDNGDGTFTDNNTKLVWEKKNAANGVPDFSNPHDVDNSYTWTEEDGDLTDPDGTLFLDFLPRLNTVPCFAGHCDWRIPTVKELQSIVDYSQVDPATSVPGDTAPPGDTVPSFYWSSTSQADFPLGVWVVFFGNGLVFGDYKNGSYYARAVRGGS